MKTHLGRMKNIGNKKCTTIGKKKFNKEKNKFAEKR